MRELEVELGSADGRLRLFARSKGPALRLHTLVQEVARCEISVRELRGARELLVRKLQRS